MTFRTDWVEKVDVVLYKERGWCCKLIRSNDEDIWSFKGKRKHDISEMSFFPKTLLFFNEAQVNYCQNLTKTLNSAREAFTEYFSVTLMQRIFLHVNLKLQLLPQRIDNT